MSWKKYEILFMVPWKRWAIKGLIPVITWYFLWLQKAFDHKEAREKGVIYPRDGVDPEYDQAIVDIRLD